MELPTSTRSFTLPDESKQDFDGQSLFGTPARDFTQPHRSTNDNMVVCPFYQRGTCKFGDNCKNEHPGSQRDANRGSSGGAFGGSNTNRFGAFGGGDRYRPSQSSGNPFGNSRDAKAPSFGLDKADIKNDMTGQRPIYPLSCYGPGREAPRQLIEGPVELSPEELRLRYYTLRTAGNEPTAQQEESALNAKMQQQVTAILENIDGAIQYVEEGANIHPNRIDIAKGNASLSSQPNASGAQSSSSSNPFLKAPANPFSSASSSQPSAFGQTSTPGFGRPAFGQPSAPAQITSAFGQPSNPGSTSSPFAATSSLGLKPSPFGQPSALGSTGFAKPAFGSSGFGQPSMPGSGGAFGQTSSLGQGSAFGQPSAPGPTSPFGQTNALGQKPSPFSNPGFGQSGFGQPSQPGTKASPFATQTQSNPSPFGQQAQSNASPFGQQAQQTSQPSLFGQQAQQSQKPNPFGQAQNQQPNPFGGATATSQPSGFSQLNTNTSNNSPFASVNQASPAQAQNPFLRSPTTPANVPTALSSLNNQISASSPLAQMQTQLQQSSSALQQQIQSPAPAGETRIDPKDRFKEGKLEEYQGEQGKILEEIYRRVGQLGHFNDDEDIPIVPPKCEWIVQVAL